MITIPAQIMRKGQWVPHSLVIVTWPNPPKIADDAKS